mgnify:FL=1
MLNVGSDLYKGLPRSGGLLDYWYPIFCYLILLSCIAAYFVFPDTRVLNFAPISIIFLIVTIASLRKVPVAHAAVILRFGRRVIDRKKSKNERTTFLFKREGWFLIFPIPLVEDFVLVSMEPKSGVINKDTVIRQLEEINSQERASLINAEEAMRRRAEVGRLIHSIMTAEGVGIVAQIPYSYRVKDPGKVVGLEGGVTKRSKNLDRSEWYESVFLKNFVPEMILSAARVILGAMTLVDALSRKVIDENGNETPIGEKIKSDIERTVNWDDYFGAEILLVRVENIFPAPGSESAFSELQDIIKAEYDYKEKKRRAEMDKTIKILAAEATLVERQREADGIRALAEANRFRVEQEAAAQAEFERRQMLVFLGKKEGDAVTPDEAEEYRRYRMGFQLAKSVDENATFLSFPELAKTLSGIGSIFSKRA